MTKQQLADRIIALQDTLFRVSYSILPNRYDQEDAVQECARIALQKIGTLRQERYFNTWVIRILIHECYNVLRKKKREVPTEEILAHLPPNADYGVMEALMQLEEQVRLPIVLHYVEGYAIREIADMLGAPESTIKTRMAKGRRQARGILSEEVDYEQAK